MSGRVSAIAINPTNPLIAYVGTAQGGVYRTLNGGTTWTQLMDNAASSEQIGTALAIGAITIDPTNASNVLVGTGEGNLSGDSFFGCGLYIITGADGGSPVVHGPYTARAGDNLDIFTGRSIVSIVVDPANHNNVFCATSSGVGGIVASAYSTLPPRGLYRSTNAFADVDVIGTPVFTRLTVNASETNVITTSAVADPSNANNLVCAIFSQSGTNTTGGIYLSTNALSATPTFTRTQALPDFINVKLAINSVAAGSIADVKNGNLAPSIASSTVTVYATADQTNGTLYKSVDGGATWAHLASVNGFAGTQGFYDIAVAVDPANASNIYVGGNTGANIFKFSTNGGTSFLSSVIGLHADVHAIAVAPSNTAVIYHGNDGGIWKSTDSGATWTSLNNSTFSATQFMALAVHPLDRFFSIGGTQDNGTEFLKPDASFTRADFGDGGYSLIDQNATDNVTVTMYHTYFNQTNNLIATARNLSVPCASDGNWSVHGFFTGGATVGYCDGSSDTLNGIAGTDTVNFYAPQALGPGNPNTWYFGTDKLYRSINKGDVAPAASQLLESGVPVSAIAISPQDDNFRVVGLNDGKVFATTLGANPLLQIAGSGATHGTTTTPATGVGRIIIDPNNKAVAYLCFNGFGTIATPIAHVWKTTNLDAITLAGSVTWTPMSTGLPDVPANAIAIDPVTLSGGSSTDVYVGTDAGVYYSPNGGTSWSVYGSGFPHAAVFGLEIQNPNRIIRAATHGRGLYQIASMTAPQTVANYPFSETHWPRPIPTLIPSRTISAGRIASSRRFLQFLHQFPAYGMTSDHTPSTEALAISGNDYFSFTVTPSSGLSLAYANLNFNLDVNNNSNSINANISVR